MKSTLSHAGVLILTGAILGYGYGKILCQLGWSALSTPFAFAWISGAFCCGFVFSTLWRHLPRRIMGQAIEVRRNLHHVDPDETNR